MWELTFESKKFKFYPEPFIGAVDAHPDVSGEEAPRILTDIPADIHTTDVFFPNMNIEGGGSNVIDLLALQLAENLGSHPSLQNAGWFTWLSDQYQVGPSNCSWLDMDLVAECFKGDRQDDKVKTQTVFALAYLFWRGFNRFLHEEERWRRYNARFLYLVSAWQWYHMARFLSGSWLAARLAFPKDIKIKGNLRWLNNEMIEATRLLQGLIKDTEFKYAVRLLAFQLRKKGFSGQPEMSEDERLLYGMILDLDDTSTIEEPRWKGANPFRWIAGNQPIWAPPATVPELVTAGDCSQYQSWDLGQVIQNRVVSESFIWEQAHLHPVYLDSEDWNLQPFVRGLIGSWLLPRYDFAGAFRLTMLLRTRSQAAVGKNRPNQRRQPHELLTGVVLWIAVLAALMFGGGWYAEQPNNIILSSQWNWVIASAVIMGFLIGPMIYIILSRFDLQTYQYLLLPRLMGGIMVGYAALVLQGDSINLKNALYTSSAAGYLLAVLLVIIVILVGGWYFFFECQVRVASKKIAQKRSIQMLVIALAASIFIGLFATGLTTAMEWQSETCVGHAMLTCPNQGIFLIGPIGFIDLRQLFVFVPLAMLTGFVSQFIFEEKPITASVWESS